MNNLSVLLYTLTGVFSCIILGSSCYGCVECIRNYRREQIKKAIKIFYVKNSDTNESLEHPQESYDVWSF